MRRRAILYVFLLVAAIVLLAWRRAEAPSVSETPPPAPKPALSDAARIAQWPAYKNGGPLQAATAALPVEKMHLRWEHKLGAETEGSPVVAAGTVYIGASDGTLHALDLTTGDTRWTHKNSSGIVAAPLVLAGNVFFGDEDGNFQAISIATHKVVWKFQASGPVASAPNFAVTPTGTLVLFGTHDMHLFCLNAEDGKVVWDFQASNKVFATPAIAADLVLMCSCDGVVRAMSLKDAAEKWTAGVGAPATITPMCANGRAYTCTPGGELACFQLSDGAEVWRTSMEGESFETSPALSDAGIVYASQGGKLYVLSPDEGKTRWTTSFHGTCRGAFVVAGDGLYLPGEDGTLRVFDLKNQTEAWSYIAGPPLISSPAIAEGRLVFCDSSGTVYCLSKE